jgi:Protein of unknown function (DUF3455)
VIGSEGCPSPVKPAEKIAPPSPSSDSATSPALLYPGAGMIPYLQVIGRGTQTYTCALSDAGAAWSAGVPDAILEGPDGRPVGTHFEGPTWKWTADESLFVGSRAAAEGFVAAPSPDDAGIDIPWLLLPRKAGTDAGVMGSARFVQRVNTRGGAVSNQPLGCDLAAAGRRVAVPYSATYIFYESLDAGAPKGGL